MLFGSISIQLVPLGKSLNDVKKLCFEQCLIDALCFFFRQGGLRIIYTRYTSQWHFHSLTYKIDVELEESRL